MSNSVWKDNVIYKHLLYKIVLIPKLVISAPYGGWIVFLGVLSGFLNFLGIPALIPVLSYMQKSQLTNETPSLLEKSLSFLGIHPNFYLLLGLSTGVILLGMILVSFSALLAQYSQAEMAKYYRKQLLDGFGATNWLHLVEDRQGEMNFSMMRQVDIGSNAHMNSQRVIVYGVQLFILTLIALQMSMTITFIALGVLGVIGILNMLNSKRILRTAYAYNKQFTRLSNDLTVLQQNKKFFKTSLANDSLLGTLKSYVDNIGHLNKSETLMIEQQQLWCTSVIFIALVFMIAFSAQLNLTYSKLLLLLFVFTRLSPNFSSFSLYFATLDSNIPMYQALTERIRQLTINKEINGSQPFYFKDPIVFDQVGLTYPGGHVVLKGVDLKIEHGKTTAIVGPSGVGKSTLLDLILGLLTPTQGKIKYGQVEHDALDKHSLRSQIAYVSQETTLMDGTLRDNLSIRATDFSDDKIREILSRVGLADFVARLPQGIDTPIGENGLKLSGGQRQRVALARALFMEPKILVLDEATSSLDALAEKQIQETIRSLKSDFTIIMVTHKLTSVKLADIIYVLGQGRIVEAGYYEELVDKKSSFYSMLISQESHTKE